IFMLFLLVEKCCRETNARAFRRLPKSVDFGYVSDDDCGRVKSRPPKYPARERGRLGGGNGRARRLIYPAGAARGFGNRFRALRSAAGFFPPRVSRRNIR